MFILALKLKEYFFRIWEKQGASMQFKRIFSPLSLPIIMFAVAICTGTILLHSPFSCHGEHISWIDSLFTATSATCVTGLTIVDTGTLFTRTGHIIILTLIQLGGLGIMTFTSLAFYLWRKRILLTDRIAVGDSLFNNSSFHLGSFLKKVIVFTFFIEFSGAFLLFIFGSNKFSVFSSVFHSISAFCNAGFSLNSDNLMQFKGNWGVNITIMVLIILGGLGFSVLEEGYSYIMAKIMRRKGGYKLSRHFGIVIKTTAFLIIAGGVFIYFADYVNLQGRMPENVDILASLFQSVTCRTAGFNTLNISGMTNASLLFMILLMFIGGAPGSCAGGIKVTTFRVLWAFIIDTIRGRDQVCIGRYAVDKETVNKALTLLFFSLAILLVSILLMSFTEGGDVPHFSIRGNFLEILFETVSAYGTVGLSTGLTPGLSFIGKIILVILMFIGRLGPLVLLSALHSIQTKVLYLKPEQSISIG